MAKKFKLVDYAKPGKGVSKETAKKEKKPGFKQFFVTYKNNFWRLISVNLIYVLANIPIVFGILAISGNFNSTSTAPSNVLFAPIAGAAGCLPTPGTTLLMGIFGTQVNISVVGSVTWALYGLTLLLLLTFGPANAGMAYILRGTSRGDHITVWHDFWRCVKKNLGQSIVMGILDAILIAVLAFDVVYFNFYSSASLMVNVMFVLSMGICIIYFFMRFYMYLLLITFKLPMFKMFKNSFIFALLNIKRNLVALVGIFAVLLVNYVILSMLTGIGILLPFIITISTCSFIAVYAAYCSVKEVMIDPYYEEHGMPESEYDDIEPIFEDRG